MEEARIHVEGTTYDFAVQVNASAEIRTGADQVARAIGGKIPRGRARATLCIALELMAAPQTEPRILLQAFGHPRRPRQWDAFNESQIKKIVAILADIGIATVPGGGVPASAEPTANGLTLAIKLPAKIDFKEVLKASPQPPKKQPSAKTGTGPKKINYKRRQERNEIVGRLGEEFALQYEQWRLRDHLELLEKIEHVALEDDTLGYDIKSFELDGSMRLVEVKATQGPLEMRFYMSAGEKVFADANPKEYVILRVGNLKTAPVLCEIRSPFSELVFLPAVYEIHFVPAEDGE